MNVSVEITLYPLAADYVPPIRDFIERLNRRPGIQVMTHAMSTEVHGPYRQVMAALTEEMQQSHREQRAVFVLKVLGGEPLG